MIANTTKDHPLIKFMLASEKGGIEAQEAQGQRQLVASEQLPAKGDWEALAKLGVKRGEHVDGDDMFVHAELPVGWQKRATDHSMWSELVDADGKVRASIFYKAAFYDRDAFISIA